MNLDKALHILKENKYIVENVQKTKLKELNSLLTNSKLILYRDENFPTGIDAILIKETVDVYIIIWNDLTEKYEIHYTDSDPVDGGVKHKMKFNVFVDFRSPQSVLNWFEKKNS